MNMKKLISCAILTVGIAFYASSIPAYKGVITKSLPDGTSIQIRIHGDENFHFTTLTDGTIVKQDTDGFYYYASVSDNGIIPTKYKVGKSDGAQQIIKMKASSESTAKLLESLRKKQIESRLNPTRKIKPSLTTSIEEQRGLVILVNFKDKTFKHDKQTFIDMLNLPGYTGEKATGSALDYFEASSYGQYQPKFDVYGPYTLPQNMAYYGGNDMDGNDRNAPEMTVEACKLAAADGVDLSVYDYNNDGTIDNVYIFYAGEGEATSDDEKTVWPHRWVVEPRQNFNGTKEDTKAGGVYVYDYACSNEINTSYSDGIGSDFVGVGTFIHEFGHVLGLPDLYITDYGSNHLTLDIYDVMDGSPYLNYGRTPMAYSGYERMFMGWLMPEQIKPSLEGTEISLPPLDDGTAFLLTADGSTHNLNGQNPNPTEFYILENRTGQGWDKYADPEAYESNYSAIGDNGMLITRINYDKQSWELNTVNNYADNLGVAYQYTENQYKERYDWYYGTTYYNYYPMLPGKYGVTEIEFGNYTVRNIRRDEATGNILFTISDKTAEPNKEGGINGVDTANAIGVTSANGTIKISGNAICSKVVNMQGITVYNGSDNEIRVTTGMYIVSVTTDSKTEIHKVIVR